MKTYIIKFPEIKQIDKYDIPEGYALYKIGRSNNPHRRAIELRNDYGYRDLKQAKLIFECDRDCELEIHDLLWQYRMYYLGVRELFVLSDAQIQDITTKYDFYVSDSVEKVSIVEPNKKKNYKTVCYSIDPDAADAIKQIAYIERRTIGDVVTQALRDYIDKWNPQYQ